jgi:diguanylate cyclase (GGDEF)-like protein
MISRKLDYYHRQLEDAAYVDTLTGIGNRRYLQEKAEGFFADSQSGVIILIDIDNFKQVIDRYGHDIGDDVLKNLTKKVSDYIRQDDIFARYSCEEFVILLPRCELDISMIKAEAIRHAVESTRTTTKSDPLQITVSIGVYEIQKEDSFDDAIKYSDIALYQAKKNGSNCIEVYK